MKKRREWPWFVIPFVLLPVIFIFGFGFRIATTEAYSVDGITYMKLLISDQSMRLALLQSYLLYWLAGVVLGGVAGMLVWLVSRRVKLSRQWKFILVSSLVGLLTLIGIVILWVTLNSGISPLEALLFVLLVSNAGTLFVWLAEKVVQAIRNRKRTCVSEVS